MSDACYICESVDEELRPYGAGGQPICFKCMTATPERESEAKKNFLALLDANAAAGSGIVVIGGEEGPVPFEVQS